MDILVSWRDFYFSVYGLLRLWPDREIWRWIFCIHVCSQCIHVVQRWKTIFVLPRVWSMNEKCLSSPCTRWHETGETCETSILPTSWGATPGYSWMLDNGLWPPLCFTWSFSVSLWQSTRTWWNQADHAVLSWRVVISRPFRTLDW